LVAAAVVVVVVRTIQEALLVAAVELAAQTAETHKTTDPREEAVVLPVEVREALVTTVQALINLVVVVVE
jgi:hypothetical protein